MRSIILPPRDYRDWSHYHPVRVYFGAGAVEGIASLLPSAGPVLIVTTAGSTSRGLTARIREILEKGGIKASRIYVEDSITPNPDIDSLDLLCSHHRHVGFRCLIAAGGGSVIDAAKALSTGLLSGTDKPLHRKFRQKVENVTEDAAEDATKEDGRSVKLDSKETIPIIAVPTTSGTGSEVTPFATVWDRKEHRKHSLNGMEYYPVHAVLDPELTLSLPARETLYTGLDAISHALESLWNRNRNAISESYAINALSLAVDHLSGVMKAPDNISHRAGMLQAATLGGYAIAITKTAFAHSVSYPLTIRLGIPHGLACGFVLNWLIGDLVSRGDDLDIPQGLLIEVSELLKRLKLRDEICKYSENKPILELIPEMSDPTRMVNFKYPVDEDYIRYILEKSLPRYVYVSSEDAGDTGDGGDQK